MKNDNDMKITMILLLGITIAILVIAWATYNAEPKTITYENKSVVVNQRWDAKNLRPGVMTDNETYLKVNRDNCFTAEDNYIYCVVD